MDDLFKLALGLAIAAMVIYLIILAIPFILGGLALYFMGRKFGHQLKSYKLTPRTHRALFGIGIGSLALSGFIVASLRCSPYFAIPMAVVTFFVVAICVLGIWGYTKLYPYMTEERLLQQQEFNLSSKVQGLEADLQRANRGIENLRQKSQGLIDEKNRLNTLILDLSTTGEARLWISLKERWLREYSDMPEGKIEEMIVATMNELKGLLQNKNGYSAEKDREMTLKATLLRFTQLERIVGPAERGMREGEVRMQGLTEEQRNTLDTLNSIKTRRTAISQTLASMKTSRIVLD